MRRILLVLLGAALPLMMAATTGGFPARPKFQTITNHTLNVGSSHVCTTACTVTGIQVGDTITIENTALQQRSSTTVLANDSVFVFNSLPVGTYVFRSQILFFDSSAGSSGMQWRWSTSGGSASTVASYMIRDFDATMTVQFGSVNVTTTAAAGIITARGADQITFLCSGSACTIALQWAQVVSTGTALHFKQGSWMSITRIE